MTTVAAPAAAAAPTTIAAAAAPTVAAPPPVVNDEKYEAAKAAVEADGTDFNAWSKLLAAVEEGATAYPDRVEGTFEAFLAKFPLCFGYWCKYADLQQKLAAAGDTEASEVAEKVGKIYDRALDAVPLSVELWKAYTAHVKASTQGQSSDALRAAFVRATTRVGHDAAAAALWDAFLELEADRGDPQTVCKVFKDMIAMDCSGRTNELWKRMKMLCKSYQCNELLSEEDRAALEARHQSEKTMTADEELDMLAQGRTAGMTELKMQRQLDQLLKEAEKAKNTLIQSRLERQHYEAGVRRWYFHVKPLDDAQLRNWRDYLTREASAAPPPDAPEEAIKAHTDKVKGLFERCLVPCALYAEFWLRYVNWARVHLSADEALAIATRAATVFLPRRADVLAALGTLLEAADRPDDARATYQALATAAETPEHRAFGALLVANFERRRGDGAAVEAAYLEALERGASMAPIRAHLARYHTVVDKDLDKARAVLEYALNESPGDAGLWQARAQVEASRLGSEKIPAVFTAVAKVYDAALGPESQIPLADRGTLWASYRAAADDLCDDAGKLLEITRLHAKWRTKADLEAVPLGPIPRKRTRAPAAAVAQPPSKQPSAAGGEADAMMEAYGDAYGS
mmetsp:Transcript_22505/g.67534  ORF Transcript_22505/g.67534 Transcript_22505/m.67534 type:complete len:629 (+) Transcript_22505:266-2152(+)